VSDQTTAVLQGQLERAGQDKGSCHRDKGSCHLFSWDRPCRRPRVFATKADALAAYRRGEINVDQPVEIVMDR
jgi:hypothetical protein